jgi:hypothetical protein
MTGEWAAAVMIGAMLLVAMEFAWPGVPLEMVLEPQFCA